MIYPRIWTDFLENRQFTIVSEQILPKTDDLLSYLNSLFMKIDNLLSYLNSLFMKTDDLPLYLNEFPEKAKKKTISLLKTSFEMVFSY